MNRALDVATSLAATLARVGVGMNVGPLGPRPEKPLELYEFEACPFCRKVREALTRARPRRARAAVSQGRPALPRGGEAAGREVPVSLSGRSEHRQGDVRVGRHRRVSVRTLRRGASAGAALARRADESLGGARLGAAARLRLPLSAGARARSFRSSCGASRLRRSAGSCANASRAWSCPTGCTTSARAARSAPPSSSVRAR